MGVSRAGFPRALKRLYDFIDGIVQQKLATQTVTNSTVLVNDDTLKFPMAANTKYRFTARLYFDTTAAGDFKWRHTGPAAPTLVRVARKCILPGATALSEIATDVAYSAADIVEATAAGTTGGYLEVGGIVHNGVNAGNFQIQWAQSTADAGNTVVLAGSDISWSVVQ